MTWVLSSEDWTGSVVDADIPFRSLGVTWQLNAPGALEVDINLSELTQTNLSPRKHILVLKHNGTRVWAGPYMTARVSLAPDNNHTFMAMAKGYFELLRYIYIEDDLEYHGANIHTIMRNLITYAQAKDDADFGIGTGGSHTGASNKASRDYCGLELPNVAESIDELTLLDDGPDWVIGPCISFFNDRQFRTYTPRRGTDVSGSVQLGQGVSSRFDFEIDAEEMANYIMTVGTDDCNPPRYDTFNATSMTNHKRAERVDELDEHEYRDLRAHGNEALRMFKAPAWHGNVTYYADHGPAFGAFDVGDIVQVTSAQTGYGTFDQQMRVMSIHIELSPPEVDFWTVELDSVVA